MKKEDKIVILNKLKREIIVSINTNITFDIRNIVINGENGSISLDLPKFIIINVFSNICFLSINITYVKNNRILMCNHGINFIKSMIGTLSSNISNAIAGVCKLFSKSVSLVGVGYNAVLNNGILELNVGYTCGRFFKIPTNVFVTIVKNKNICIKSASKESLGNFVSKICLTRRVNPYKGTGVLVDGKYYYRKDIKKN